MNAGHKSTYSGTGIDIDNSGIVLYAAWLKKPMLSLVDLKSGEMHDACIFYTTLGSSFMPFMKAFPGREQKYWMQGLIGAIKYYGGLPALIAPRIQNTPRPPAYLSPSNDSAFGMFSESYDIPVLPVNAKHPSLRSDVTVFRSVAWFMWYLRDKVFYSMEELNEHINQLLSRFVVLPYNANGDSMFNVFCAKDKPLLRPLPQPLCLVFDIAARVVGDNCFVQYDQHYYSVPYKFCKQKVNLHISESEIVIYDADRNRLASHKRGGEAKYITVPAHMPPKYRLFGYQVYDGSKYVEWAAHIGDNTRFVIEYLLSTAKYEQQAFKNCMAILQLSKKHGNHRLESACKSAKRYGYISYYTIKKFVFDNPVDSNAVPVNTTMLNDRKLRLDNRINR